MSERLDALLSAQQDGALEPAERAELDRLLETSEAARARAAAFAQIDAALRGLGHAGIAAERLARGWDAIARRRAQAAPTASDEPIARTASTPPASSAVGAVTPGRRFVRGMPGSGVAAALAAGLVLAAFFGLRRLPIDSGPTTGDPGGQETEVADVLAVDGLAASEVAALGLEQAEDVDVVAELELLDFLAARERAGEAPRG
ncbi:MAG: hypothetical protein R3F35_11110 [Myxococcota bacterium]